MLRGLIPQIVLCAEVIYCREQLLGKMFALQKNPKLKLSYEEAVDAELKRVLVANDSYIDAVDLFGMPTFVRLSRLVTKLSGACSEHLAALYNQYGEVITYRGANYAKVVEAAADVEAKWAKFRGDWRKMPMPRKATYEKNPFLRRLGESVA